MIPFVDLKAQYKLIEPEVKLAMDKVLENTNFILGQEVSLFEEEFAEFCQAKYCVGVASGTDALHLALRILNIGPGDEVITVANTFVATVLAISYVGAKPVLVDIDEKTFNMNLDLIERLITPKTKAIIPVHLYGRALDMNKILDIAKRYNLYVVEDACQGHGAWFNGKRVGSQGIIGCFSFYPGKNLGAYADGGAVVTSNQEIYEKLKMLRNYGSPKKYYHDFIGYNSRLDTMQAAVLRVKLKYLDNWNKQRWANAQIYNQKLNGIGDLILPQSSNKDGHVFHLYVIRTKQRDKLMDYLVKRNIQCGIHYPVPIYALKAYAGLGFKENDFPVTQELSKDILSLPMFPELSIDQIEEVVARIREFFS